MPVKKKARKPVKKKNPSIKGLDEDQRAFIESKVKELGDLESVAKFYRLDDAVSYYANKMAKKFKLPKEKKDA